MLLLLLEQSQRDSAGVGMAVMLLLVMGVIAVVKGASGGSGGSGLYSGRAGRSMPRPQATDVLTPSTTFPTADPSPRTVHAARTVDFGTFPIARWLRDRGWSHDNGTYRGHFAAGGTRVIGEVRYRNEEYQLLLYRPPTWATRGSHSGCWKDRGDGWRLLHLNETPSSVVTAILGCEAFLLKKLEENAA